MVPASTAPQLALIGSLVAHAAVFTAFAGLGYARSSHEDAQPQTLIAFETIEPVQPAEPTEPVVVPPPAALPPPRIARDRIAPAPQTKRPEPQAAQPVASLAPAPLAPAPTEAPITPVATVDAAALSTSSITAPAAAPSQRVGAPGVIAARAPTNAQSFGKSLTASIDRSRRAGLADSARWDCPFPSEAESEGIEAAKAVLRVELDAHGQPMKIIVTDDPGHGFGREARRCAMRRRWTSRLDHSGAPAADAVTVVVSFERS